MNAGGDPVVEAEAAGDVRAAFAARGDEFRGKVLAVADEGQHATDALRQSFSRTGVAQNEAGNLRHALRIDGLEVLLHRAFVAAVELPEPGGVAAATGVLQKQCVEQVGALGRAETEMRANRHADPAASQGVAGRLAFREVERVAEGADDFGQPEETEAYSGARVDCIVQRHKRAELCGRVKPRLTRAGACEDFMPV